MRRCAPLFALACAPADPICLPAAMTEAVGAPEATHVLNHTATNNAAWVVGVGDDAVWTYATADGVVVATVGGVVVVPAGAGAYAINPAIDRSDDGVRVVWVEVDADASRLVYAAGPVDGLLTPETVLTSRGALIYPAIVATERGAVVLVTDRGPDRLDNDHDNDDDALRVLTVGDRGVTRHDDAFALLDGYVAQRDGTIAAEGDTVVVVTEQECATCCAAPPCTPGVFRDPHLFVQRSVDGGATWAPALTPLLAGEDAVGDDPSACLSGGQLGVVWRDVGDLRFAWGAADGPIAPVDIDALSPGRMPVARCGGSSVALAWVIDDFAARRPLDELSLGFSVGPVDASSVDEQPPLPGRVVQVPTLTIDGPTTDRWWVDAAVDFDDGAFRLIRECP
jgi:hypothetical protein